jgi:hypothetical protein
MVRTSRFEKLLEIVFQLPCLALEIMFSGRDILLVRAVYFLVIIVAAGSDCDPSGAPLLAVLSAFRSAFAGGFECCCRVSSSHRPEQRCPRPPHCHRCVGWRYQAAPYWCSIDRGQVHAPRSSRLCWTRMLR